MNAAKKILFVIFPVLLVFSEGCAPASWKRAEQAHRSGDMVGAVMHAAQTLHGKPGYKHAVRFLKDHLPVYYNRLENHAAAARQTGDWDAAHDAFSRIARISDLISSLPPQNDPDSGSPIIFEVRDVSERLAEAQTKAAEMHYRRGREYEAAGKYREAARSYTRVREYLPDYRDSMQRYERSRSQALQRIAVIPFDNLSGKRQFGALGEIVADQLISHVMSDRRNLEFMEFVTRERLNQLIAEQRLGQSGFVDLSSAAELGRLLGIHAFIFGKILSVTTHYYPETREVVREEKEISRGRNEPKISVSATVTVITRKATARMVSSYQIVDVESGTIVHSATIPQEVEVRVEFARFRGDERALSTRYKALCDRGESFPPPVDELVFSVADMISKSLAREVAGHFN